jgi:hypothetical protein
MTTLTKRQVDALENVPALRRALTQRAYEGKASPRQAIKAKCLECCGNEDAIPRIRDCQVSNCPIWAYRPYQTDIDAEE